MNFFPVMVAGLLVLVAVMWARLDDPSTKPKTALCIPPYRLEWRNWEPGAFEKARLEGKVVWLNFTCDWGPTIKVNEQRLFGHQGVLDKLAEHEVIMIRADVTLFEPMHQEALKKFGRMTVPTDILAPADPKAEVIILPELLSPETAMEALDQAAG